MNLKARITIAGAVLLVAGTFAGCGGDSEEESLSKSEFIAQVDTLCAENNDVAAELSDEVGTAYQAGDYEAAADALEQQTDSTVAMVDKVKELTPPEEDQATIDEMLAISDEQQALAGDLVVAVGEGDDASVNQMSEELGSLADEFNVIADDYGFVDCGSAGDV